MKNTTAGNILARDWSKEELAMVVRHACVGLLVLTLAFMGINIVPAALSQAQAQSYGVAGVILGLAIIAGVVYLISRDRDGVYHRYYYGRYSGPPRYYNGGYHRPHYDYDGPYYQRYNRYRGSYYGGPLPRYWR